MRRAAGIAALLLVTGCATMQRQSLQDELKQLETQRRAGAEQSALQPRFGAVDGLQDAHAGNGRKRGRVVAPKAADQRRGGNRVEAARTGEREAGERDGKEHDAHRHARPAPLPAGWRRAKTVIGNGPERREWRRSSHDVAGSSPAVQ